MKIEDVETGLNKYKIKHSGSRLYNVKTIKLKKIGNCFECTSHRPVRGGYPASLMKGKMKMLHRISYMVFNGKLSSDIVVRHSCDNPKCVNPKHLIAGTNYDNVQDRVKRKRSAYGSSIHTSTLTKTQVRDIFLNRTLSNKEMALKHGVYASNVSRIRSGKQWKIYTDTLINQRGL